MNSSHFMDKQIMDLSAAGGGGGGGVGELLDLMNPQEESHGNGGGSVRKEEILPSYDFQPIRTVGSSSSIPSSSNFTSGGAGGGSTSLDAASAARHSWGPSDSKIAALPNLGYANLEPRELAKVSHDKDKDSYHVATIIEIERTVKKYADNLLHALEGVGARLTQLESRTHHLESSVDELKVSTGNNSGSNDGKLRQLENILREVQTGVQVLRDKQEIAEAQIHLTKLQQSSSKAEHYRSLNEPSNTAAGPDSRQQQQSPPPPLTYQPPPPPVPQPQPPPPSPPTPNAPLPPPPLQQNQNPPQYPPQFPQTQPPSLPREPSYFPPQGPPPPPLQQQYQPSPHYSHPMPPSQSVNPSSQFHPPLAHHPEESAPYMPQPPPTYPPSIRPLTQPAPTSGAQYYGPGYPGPGISDPYPYSGSPTHYNSSSMMIKPSPFSNSPPPSVGGSSSSSYPRLPTAKILPQVAPAGSGSGGSPGGDRVPVDDVVDKVSTMGFSREQVKATVRKLTENGQSVDLNVVLDKLMNEGGEMIQPQKGWFGR